MRIGAMNHPQKDVVDEIRWMAGLGLEFLDLTLEPPAAASWRVDIHAIRDALRDYGMGIVGHTAYYLPIESPFEPIRQAAVDELKRCADLFAVVGAKYMNIHPGRYTPMHPRTFFIDQDLRSLREIHEHASPQGVQLMVENIPGDFNTVAELGDLLNEMPDLWLHLDIGHANLMVPANTTGDLLKTFGKRLAHVHLHDNRGGTADLHLPLGVGEINHRDMVQLLIRAGYNDTITLEVFGDDPLYLKHSMEILRQLWEEETIRAAS